MELQDMDFYTAPPAKKDCLAAVEKLIGPKTQRIFNADWAASVGVCRPLTLSSGASARPHFNFYTVKYKNTLRKTQLTINFFAKHCKKFNLSSTTVRYPTIANQI